MEYFYPLIGKCALTKPKEQGGGREILYREPGKAAEHGRSGDAGDFLLQGDSWEEVVAVGILLGSGAQLGRTAALLVRWRSPS